VTAASSSISDTDPYRTICRQAAGDPAVFRTFKRDPRYQLVLEHVTPPQGASYLMGLLERAPEFAAHFDRFRRNDSLGSPLTHDYGPGIGVFSPTTCRYMKVLSDLLLMFGDLSGMNIVEVGGGYGGQCFAIHALCRPASYTILDLAEAGQLQRVYLDQLGVGNVTFRSMQEVQQLAQPLDCDLFISNYALTECARPITDVYLDKVVRGAHRGYVTGNRIGVACYSQTELMGLIPQCLAIEEVPKTAIDNYLLVWKTVRQAARPVRLGV
jgi:putative sugar O-methyltransferase